MAGNRFEIVSNGAITQQTSKSFPNSDASITIYDIDIISTGYRIDWRENYKTFGLFAQEASFSQNFTLNGAATSGAGSGGAGGSTSTTLNGLTYLVRED